MSDYYKIVEANNIVTLELKVSDYVKKGWIPVGNIREEIHDKYNLDITYSQAVYKPMEKKE